MGSEIWVHFWRIEVHESLKGYVSVLSYRYPGTTSCMIYYLFLHANNETSDINTTTLRPLTVSVKMLFISVLMYDIISESGDSGPERNSVFSSRCNQLDTCVLSAPLSESNPSHTGSCMLAMRTLCELGWACTTTPGSTATNSRRRGRMMIDRFSRPTVFAGGRGKRETR